MRHKKTFRNTILLAPLVALALALGGCDSGTEQTASETEAADAAVKTDTPAQGEAAEPGTDYSTMVNAEQVREGLVFGEITIGNPDAPAMIEYASLTCPHCATYHREIHPQVLEKYVKPGRLKVVFRNYVRDRADLAVAMLSRCFGEERVMDLMTFYFERQRQWVTQDAAQEIRKLALQAGINRVEYDACLANTELQRNLVEMTSRATNEDNITGTPTFLIGDERIVGVAPFNAFEELIDDIL